MFGADVPGSVVIVVPQVPRFAREDRLAALGACAEGAARFDQRCDLLAFDPVGGSVATLLSARSAATPFRIGASLSGCSRPFSALPTVV